jgi:phenylpropionate dioxygenase-like ring-hydroxylating dioxygenase large terminal subunit
MALMRRLPVTAAKPDKSFGTLKHSTMPPQADATNFKRIKKNMFERFANQWTPVLPIRDITSNPLATELAGERLVLFSDGSRWHALLDHCPHRGARLSLGAVTDGGHLRCPYHGWQFDGAGACTQIPLNSVNAAGMARAAATALPTREIAGCVWVYTGTAAPHEPQLPAALTDPDGGYVTYTQEWQAHWTRAVENFVDFAHPPYLHERTIGAWSRPFADSGGQAYIDIEPTDFGMTVMNYFGSRRHGFRLEWHRPNMSVLHFGQSAANRLHVFSIPLNEQRTRVMNLRWIPAGSNAAAASQQAGQVDHPILDEDRVIVESQSGDVLSDPREVSVGTDQPSLVFRRYYAELLASGERTGEP